MFATGKWAIPDCGTGGPIGTRRSDLAGALDWGARGRGIAGPFWGWGGPLLQSRSGPITDKMTVIEERWAAEKDNGSHG